MTAAELTLIREFFADTKLSSLNTRALKKGDSNFVITVYSTNKIKTEHDFKGPMISVEYGEFTPYLQEVNYYLTKAREYAANDN